MSIFYPYSQNSLNNVYESKFYKRYKIGFIKIFTINLLFQ